MNTNKVLTSAAILAFALLFPSSRLLAETPQATIPSLIDFINEPVATVNASARVPQEANTTK